MTEVNQVPIHCETCQKSFDYTIYQNVNVTETPELKEKLINQTVFQCTCPHCGQKYFIPYILNYQDMDKKILIHFYPKEEEMQKKMPQMAERALAVSNWLLKAREGETSKKYRKAYSILNTYNNEVQAILDPDEDFERNDDGTLIVSDRAMIDVLYAYDNEQLVFGSR